jgi:hypothetical protein
MRAQRQAAAGKAERKADCYRAVTANEEGRECGEPETSENKGWRGSVEKQAGRNPGR